MRILTDEQLNKLATLAKVGYRPPKAAKPPAAPKPPEAPKSPPPPEIPKNSTPPPNTNIINQSKAESAARRNMFV